MLLLLLLLLFFSKMMAVVLRRIVVLGVEGHGVGGRPVHHGGGGGGATVHHVAHSAGVGAVGAAGTRWIQRHCQCKHMVIIIYDNCTVVFDGYELPDFVCLNAATVTRMRGLLTSSFYWQCHV